jgi:hypothetical protein
MRRTLLVGGSIGGTLGGSILLTAATATACSGPGDVRTPPPATISAEQAATRLSCEALGQAYNQKLAPFARAVTGMVNGRTPNGKPAQQALRDLASAIRTATGASADENLRANGKQTADALTAKATDDAFFRLIKTPDDVRDVLGPDLTQWLAPVTKYCS